MNLAIGSEHQAYMSLMSEDLNQTIALHATLARENVVAREQAITAILQRKGRVLDAMTESLAALRQRLGLQDRNLFDRLNDTNARLADLALNAPPRGLDLAEYQNQIAAIQEQKEKLEVQLSRLSASFYQSSPPLTLDAVQALIPSNAALVEFAVYRPFDLNATDKQTLFGEPRYVTYVIRHQGNVQWTDLGPVKAIDTRIDALRHALRDPRRKDTQELARVVDEMIMQAVRKLIGDATHLLIAPDGHLNLIPFEALVNEQGHHLIERYRFSYLTSGRDLLRTQVARKSKKGPLVVASPSFGEATTEQIARTNVVEKPRAPRDRRRSVTTARNLSEIYFAPLSGTAQEARSIQMLFSEAQLLMGSKATESALKRKYRHNQVSTARKS